MRLSLLPLLLCSLAFQATNARQWFVAPGGRGDGSSAAPFGSIQSALDAAEPGDTINVRAGTYRERLTTRRDGTAAAPITLRAESEPRSVIVEVAGSVAQIGHAHLVIDGIVFDAQYASDDGIRVNTSATGFTLRNSEVRRATGDCVELAAPSAVLIEASAIHHCLNAAGGRSDAHGIVAGAVRNLTIRHTEVHTFSGDALQLDPDRSAPGWDSVTVEGCRFWLAPLDEAANGFAKGVVPGENAIDTKARPNAPRARLVVRDTIASGFRNGLISNMAAFNVKENVDALFDGVTAYDSFIAFRTRGQTGNGGAWVRVQNAVVYDVNRAIRYENDIERLSVFNTTIGVGVERAFQAAASKRASVDVRNTLLVAEGKPAEAAGASNLAVDASHFVDAAGGDYRLRPHSTAIDAGVTIAGLTADRAGTTRPQGKAYDIGAFEAAPSAAARVTSKSLPRRSLLGRPRTD